MSDFLRTNGFKLLFKGHYRRISKKRGNVIGKWKAKSTGDSNDKIIGFTSFRKPDLESSYHYGSVYIDAKRNGKFDPYNRESDSTDLRFPTSYRGLDYSKEMIGVKAGKVQIWLGTQAKIPYVQEYMDGYYKIRINNFT